MVQFDIMGELVQKYEKIEILYFLKISRKSPIRPPRAVRAARGAFNVWLRTVHAAATLRPPIGVLADPAASWGPRVSQTGCWAWV